MERWSDRPVPEQDPIERFAAASSAFFKQYFSPIAKFAPPAAGFAVFLLYFYANHFYPSFDLLQFSSLLLGAGLMGFVIIGLLWFGMLVPGFWFFHSFIQHSEVRSHIADWLGRDEEHRTRRAVILVLICYAGPYCLCSLILSSVLLYSAKMYLFVLFTVTLLVALLFGLVLQRTLRLARFNILRFAFHAWVPILIACGVAFTVIADTAKFIDGLDGKYLKIAVFYLIPLGACLLAAISALGSFGGFNYALHFSLFFALAIAFYSGVLAGLPERVVKGLGLGAYEANAIALKNDYCEKSPPEMLKLDQACTLKNVHVVWSLGESLILRLDGDSNAQAQIPSRYVKAIVRQHD